MSPFVKWWYQRISPFFWMMISTHVTLCQIMILAQVTICQIMISTHVTLCQNVISLLGLYIVNFIPYIHALWFINVLSLQKTSKVVINWEYVIHLFQEKCSLLQSHVAISHKVLFSLDVFSLQSRLFLIHLFLFYILFRWLI